MNLLLEGTVSSITLRSVDTDVLALAVAASNRHKDRQIWVNYGDGENKIFAAHKIPIVIGSEKATALPVFQSVSNNKDLLLVFQKYPESLLSEPLQVAFT